MIYGNKFYRYGVIDESVITEDVKMFIENCIDTDAINEHAEFLNEAYFGKTKALLELESAIHDLRKHYELGSNMIGTKDIKRVEDAIKKQFNMEYFSLNIIPQNIPNAFTYKIATRFDIAVTNKLKKMVIADQKNGYRFRDKNGLVIVVAIYSGVLLNPEFTDAEIVAILLHEIGHNFSDVISNYVKLGNNCMLVLWVIKIIIQALLAVENPKNINGLINGISSTVQNTNVFQKIKKEFMENYSELFDNVFFRAINAGIGMFKDVMTNIAMAYIRLIQGTTISIGSLLFGGTDNILKVRGILDKPFDFVQKLTFKRHDEIIGDKFAAIYGYGPEQYTALNKLKKTLLPAEDIIRQLPYGDVFLANAKVANIDSFAGDSHPHNIQRLNTMIHSLEFELSKPNLEPEIKKTVEKQLKEMNKLKEDFLKLTNDEEEYIRTEKVFAAIVEKKMPEATLKSIEDKINKSIDDYCNKNYK